jgi:hypothetical protein
MGYTELDLERMEADIRLHLQHVAELNRLKSYLTHLENQKSQIESDWNNSNVTLEASTPAYSFDREPVYGTGSIGSYQERQIDNVFNRLEHEHKQVCDKIVDVKTDIRCQESLMYDMNYILNLLNDTARQFIHLHYEVRIGYKKIAVELNISSATISRLRVSVLTAMLDYKNNMKQK